MVSGLASLPLAWGEHSITEQQEGPWTGRQATVCVDGIFRVPVAAWPSRGPGSSRRGEGAAAPPWTGGKHTCLTLCLQLAGGHGPPEMQRHQQKRLRSEGQKGAVTGVAL